MIRLLVSVMVASAIFSGIVPSDKCGAEEVTAAEVRNSVDKAVRFLKSRQDTNGSWPRDSDFKYGITPLCTLALLNAGVKPDDRHVARAIRYIKNLKLEKMSTYSVSLRIMVMTNADPAGRIYRADVQRDVDWLLEEQVKLGRNVGGWGYGNRKHPSVNTSTCQFALLGLHEASRIGIRIPQENWRMAARYWAKAFVKRGGGFDYSASGLKATGSMTCAGISSVIIVEENLANEEKFIKNGKINCCADNRESLLVEAALDWLARSFSMKANPQGGRRGDIRTKLYYMYSLERAGRLSGRRFIGAHDWYREGVEQLIRTQGVIGSWKGYPRFGEDNLEIASSLGLLFLSKGKRPVVICKYQHGVDSDWDLHPKGINQLTRNLEIQWNRKLNWQTINGKEANLDDLRETPVLFFSGRDNLRLNPTQKENLKKYIEHGGFIFAEACQEDGCGENVEFDRRFRGLMAELFPTSELAPIPPDHPVWNAHFRIKQPNQGWPLLGLQACCRTSVIYCPRNLTCYWQVDRPNLISLLNKNVQDEVRYCSRLGVNIISYATGQQLRDKLDIPKIAEDRGQQILGDRVLVFPKLQHGGGSDEAPNAWNNILTHVRQAGLRIKMEKKLIGATTEELRDYPFVFMHGRDRFTFTPEQRLALREHLLNRGFLFVDSICSSEAFAKSFRREIKEILPGYSLQPIPPEHPLWNDDKFGGRVRSVSLRVPDDTVVGGFRETKTPPLMEGVTIDDHLAVVFSPFDLSCALENATVSQCQGYTHQDAAIMGRQIVLYYLQSD